MTFKSIKKAEVFNVYKFRSRELSIMLFIDLDIVVNKYIMVFLFYVV